jgi:hypothetical protein
MAATPFLVPKGEPPIYLPSSRFAMPVPACVEIGAADRSRPLQTKWPTADPSSRLFQIADITDFRSPQSID